MDYECPEGHHFEHIVHHGETVDAFVRCPVCHERDAKDRQAKKIPSVWGNYKIKGNNSASETPKRWKGY